MRFAAGAAKESWQNRRSPMNDYKILRDFGELATDRQGNKKKLVCIEWFGRAPVYEIRMFAPDGRPLKRASFTGDEVVRLRELLDKIDR